MDFGIHEAAEFSGQSEGNLYSWHAHGLRCDAELKEDVSRRRYSERDLVCLRVMAELVGAGLSRENAAKIVNDEVRTYFDAPKAVLIVRKSPLAWEATTVDSDVLRSIRANGPPNMIPPDHPAVTTVVIALHVIAAELEKKLEEREAKNGSRSLHV